MTRALDTADRLARDAAKRSLRRYGEMTASIRSGPDFAIVGAKRGGTTSLYNYLLEHPSVTPMFPGREHIKGAHYFDVEYPRGADWYRSHFPMKVAGRQLARPHLARPVTGEGSPYYLFHPLAAQRMAADVPDVRLVILLRDPVERAYSHYKERLRNGREALDFEDALDAEPARLRGEAERIAAEPGYHSVAHEDHSYVAQGRYLDMLPRWFERFPPEQFHIVASEDFYEDPNRIANEVWAYLGLSPFTLRSRKRHNFHQAQDLPAGTRERLRETFADHNRELEEYLGRQLPWPTASAPAGSSAVVPGATADAERRTPVEPWPAVTVVVATRNRPELLERAVRSIVGQNYPGRVECIVVFDQSDPAPVSLELPGDRHVRATVNSRSPGLAGARNTGYLLADTPLVATCDDDDRWDADKLRLQVERLVCSAAEVVACGVRIHYGDRLVDRVPPPSVEFAQLVRERVAALHPSTFVIRREALLDGIGLVDEDIPGSYGEDYDWLLRAAKRGPVVSVERALADVYWHEQSFFAERWATIEDALHYLLKKHPELRSDPHGLARIEGQIAFAAAARGDKRAAYQASRSALRNNALERRGYLALAVASGVVSGSTIVRLANRRGRGI
jgi:glycosyltransferase involved in cell wall biosynthesis